MRVTLVIGGGDAATAQRRRRSDGRRRTRGGRVRKKPDVRDLSIDRAGELFRRKNRLIIVNDVFARRLDFLRKTHGRRTELLLDYEEPHPGVVEISA